MSKYKKTIGAVCAALIIAYIAWPSANTPSASAITILPTDKSTASNTAFSIRQSSSSNASMGSKLTHKDELPTTNQAFKELSPIERIRAIQDKTPLHQSLLDDHQQFTRYPSYNKAIASSSKDPITSRYEAYERNTLSKDKRYTLTIQADKRFYLNDEVATFYASMKDQHGNSVSTHFAAQVIFEEQRNITQLDFSPVPGTDIQSASLTLDAATYAEGIYKVLIVNQANELADAVTFTLSRPHAILTGEYRDQIVGGKLRILAEVEVAQKNRYYLEASLYSSTEDPIGTTQFSAELNAGTHWVPLDFSGLMILDSGEPAPFVLRSLSLAKVAMPIQRAPLASPHYATAPYDLTEFSREEPLEQDSL